MLGNPLGNSRSQATHDGAVLDGDDAVVTGSCFLQNLLIDRFQEDHVIVAHVDALFLQAVDHLDDLVADVTNAEHSHTFALVHAAAAADGQGLHFVMPLGDNAFAARIADGKGTKIVALGGEHQVAQVVLVDGRCYNHAGNAAQVGQVKQSVMGHAVLADNAATVDAEGHWQSLDGHIVDDGVIATLQEGAIDGAVGAHAVLGKASSKGHCMALADAHVKGASRHRFQHQRHRCAARHGGSDADNLIILLGQFDQCLAEHILVLDGTAFAALSALAGFLVKFSRCMPGGGVGLGSRKSLALDGAHVYQFGAFHILDFAEYLDQPFHVMTVIQAKVADIQALEDVLLTGQQGLHRIAESHDQSLAVIIDDIMAPQELIGLIAHLVIAVRRVQVAHVGT